jgi:low affinity Fe/Cu permease
MPGRAKRKRKPLGFARFASRAARWTGTSAAFLAAVCVVVVWLVTGPLFHFSDTWQLVINTGTTIVTFLMVFLIQSTQNRDAEAVQIKLNEIIRALQGAHTGLLDLDELTIEELDRFKQAYAELAKKARHDIREGRSDTGAPEMRHPAFEEPERPRGRKRAG